MPPTYGIEPRGPQAAPAPTPAPSVDPTAVDQEVITAQQAANAAETNLKNARQRYDNAAEQYDKSKPTGPLDETTVKAAADLLQRASVALGQSEMEYATSLRQLSTARGSAATRVQSPETKAALLAQAKANTAQADLAEAQARTHQATTDAALKTANAQLETAQTAARRAAADIEIILPATANDLNARATDSLAQAKEANARSSILIPAQAAQAAGAAAASAAQAGKTTAETTTVLPAQVEEILASAGLSEAQKDQIRQAMKLPKQITQGADQRNIPFQDPTTGVVSSQPNPAYTAAGAQLFQNQADTLAQIQGMLEKGQMGPLEAQSYMDAVKAQTASTLRGTNPFAETTQRQNYARDAGGIGRDILNNRVANATSLASTLLNSIKPSVPGSTFDFSTLNPFDMVKGLISDVGGGAAVGQTAQSLLQGVQSAGQPQTAPDGLPHDPKYGPINGQARSLDSYAVNPQRAA